MATCRNWRSPQTGMAGGKEGGGRWEPGAGSREGAVARAPSSWSHAILSPGGAVEISRWREPPGRCKREYRPGGAAEGRKDTGDPPIVEDPVLRPAALRDAFLPPSGSGGLRHRLISKAPPGQSWVPCQSEVVLEPSRAAETGVRRKGHGRRQSEARRPVFSISASQHFSFRFPPSASRFASGHASL